MFHYLGNSGVARYENLRFWADRGLIHVEDDRDNSYKVLSVVQALHRINALSEMLGRTHAERDGFADAAKTKKIQDFVDNMVAVIQKAREQGMPTDDSAGRDLRRRQPKTVLMPRASASF